MNYNSIEEILSAGITNMTVIRNNTKQDDDTDTIGGVNWFTFDENVASKIYVSGNSWIGFGKSSEQLKINRRDGAMYSLYREEGTLYNYYKFLKIRWVGYTTYNGTTSDLSLVYDVILWDTGDISLHMVTIPTSNNNGTYSLVTSSDTYTYTVSTSSPDVTFKKTDTGFEVSNSIIEIIKVEFRYLIRSGTTYYTVTDNSLIEVEINELNSDTFLTNGIDFIPQFSLIANLDNPEILYWVSKVINVDNVIVNGLPSLPQIDYYNKQNITQGSAINNIEVTSSNDTLFAVSFDDGVTWKYYDNSWITVSNETQGMSSSIIKNITPEQWAEITNSTSFQFRCVLPSSTSYAGIMGIKYK